MTESLHGQDDMRDLGSVFDHDLLGVDADVAGRVSRLPQFWRDHNLGVYLKMATGESSNAGKVLRSLCEIDWNEQSEDFHALAVDYVARLAGSLGLSVALALPSEDGEERNG